MWLPLCSCLMNFIFHFQTESASLLEVGCKVQDWKFNEVGFAQEFQWIPSGELLEDGACVNSNYSKHFLPLQVKRRIYTTIAYQKVRVVDSRKQTVSLDLTLWMRWRDPDVKFKFSDEDWQNEGLVLSPNATTRIWNPNLHFKNRTVLKPDEEWKKLVSSKILTRTTEIELKYEIKLTVYCHFDHSRYPMDQQTCNVNIGSGGESETFVLKPSLEDTNRIHHLENKYRSDNFEMTITFFDENIDSGENLIGITIIMCRLQTSFIFMYYLPCITIVLVSLIGFVFPISALPGRTALLVTLFWTLLNMSIQQMVKTFLLLYISQ